MKNCLINNTLSYYLEKIIIDIIEFDYDKSDSNFNFLLKMDLNNF